MIRFDTLGNLIVYVLYKILVYGDGAGRDDDQLAADFFKNRVSKYYIARATSSLIRNGLLASEFDEEVQEGYMSVTDKGIRHIEQLLDDGYAYFKVWDERGVDGFVPDPVDTKTSREKLITNSPEEKWEPLPIERNSQDYQEALRAVEAAIAEVGQSNGYAIEHHEERDSILSTLKLGLEALKSESAVGSVVNALLVKPLKYLVAKFPEAAIGAAAGKALEWVLRITGLT
jgi:hypothetical protein